MDAETYKAILEQLYYSAEFNKAIVDLAAARDKGSYAKCYLQVLKLQQEAHKNAMQEMQAGHDAEE